MIIHLYTLCWNEADILPFFFRHYDPWVDKYVIFDDGSTDGSLDILKEHPRVELRQFKRTYGDSFVLSHHRLQNNVWKGSRGHADWVIITAIDEHLYKPNQPMQDYLEQCFLKGLTLIPAIGFQMLSKEFPGQDEILCLNRTFGAPWHMMNKLSIFNPDAITETNFCAGRHLADPVGDIIYPDKDELLLLHYKFMEFERVLQRHMLLKTGLGKEDVARKFATAYSLSRRELVKLWNMFAKNAINIARPDLDRLLSRISFTTWWRNKQIKDKYYKNTGQN